MTYERALVRQFPQKTIVAGNLETNSFVLDISRGPHVSYIVNAVVNGTAAVVASASITVATDTMNLAAHGLASLQVVQVTTSSALPAGLALATNYFVIRVDDNNFKVASSVANAIAGTAVDITTQGTGNQTFTPVAITGGSYKLQWSNNYKTWTDIAGVQQTSGDWIDAIAAESTSAIITNNITATAVSRVSGTNAPYAFARILFAITNGATIVNVSAMNKGV